MLLIGSRIQEYRKKAGLNQEEFAEKMGVSRQAVSKWERDKAYPDLDRLVCICEILDVQVGELIYGKGEEPEAPEEVSGDGTSANNAVHLKNLRGKGRLARLKILFCVMAAICVFCVIVVAVLFVRNEWTSHSDKWRRCISSIQKLIWHIWMTMAERSWILCGLMYRGYGMEITYSCTQGWTVMVCF